LMVKTIQWTPELVERFWSGVAETRLSELSFSKQVAEQIIDLVNDALQPQGRHLDFGAGEGDLVKALLERGYATAAYEPARARASRMAPDILAHPKYLGTIQGGATERFDVILMIEVIEHILEPDLPGVLRTVHSLLVDGGTLIVTTPGAEDLELGSSYCPQCDTLFHRWQHQRSFTPESLSAMLAEYGFDCVSLRAVDFSHTSLLVEEIERLNKEIEVLRRSWAFALLARLYRLFTYKDPTKREPPPRDMRAYKANMLYIGRKAH